MVDHFAGRMPECLKQLVVTDGGMLFHPSIYHVFIVYKLGCTLHTCLEG